MTATAMQLDPERAALPVCLSENPYRLVSLWTLINQFDASGFGNFLLLLKSREFQIAQVRSERGGDDSLQQVDHLEIRRLLKAAYELGAKADFKDTLAEISMIEQYLAHDATISRMYSEIQRLSQQLIKDLTGRKFLIIAPLKGELVDNDHLFGEPVTLACPNAANDIKEAGNCLAIESHTATVFHLMRVAEHGLRMLAKSLRVKLTDSGHVQAIETADWDKVITGLKNKILSVRQNIPKGSRRDLQLGVYSDLADHCLFMKDIWRNSVSHTRKPYKPHEALTAFDRVRDFMTALAQARGHGIKHV